MDQTSHPTLGGSMKLFEEFHTMTAPTSVQEITT